MMKRHSEFFSMTTVILFGATGKTGLALSKLIIKNDMELFAAARTETDRKYLESLGANAFIADVLHPNQSLESMRNVNGRSIVISLVGGSSKGTGVRADYLGNKNIIEAAVTSGLKRFIFVTSIGSGESRHELPDVVKPFLGPIAAEKTKAENVLRETDLDFTIIRPGQLTDDRATGNGALTEECILGIMTREDLALMIMNCIKDDGTIAKIYSVLDPSMKVDLSWINNK
jgi:nucleoside-diphosphate-sugar epimerase